MLSIEPNNILERHKGVDQAGATLSSISHPAAHGQYSSSRRLRGPPALNTVSMGILRC